MRILVHEFVTGGGLATRDVPESLAREGATMRAALLEDLAASGRHRILATADPRFPIAPLQGVEVDSAPDPRDLAGLIASVDAVWLVAPETGGSLERLAGVVERLGTRNLGSPPMAIRRAADKARLGGRLARHGIRSPRTWAAGSGTAWPEWEAAASVIGYPVVVKPARGAGSEAVSLVDSGDALRTAVERARLAGGRDPALLQEFVAGVPASVSLLCDGRRAVALTLNAQTFSGSRGFVYHGGHTPLEHPLSAPAREIAARTVEALGDLRGYVGVDLVLTDSDPVVIEVNPRLTTAYLGVRGALEENVAELALDACSGVFPRSLSRPRRVFFTASGRTLRAPGPEQSRARPASCAPPGAVH